MFDRILVPTDGSDCARAAIGHAEDLARRYGATVHLLSVVDARILENGPHYERLEADRTELVAETRATLADAVPSAIGAVRSGVPYRAILRYADEEDVDLIVMGTHGRTGVQRYLLGSVTEKVLRLSDAPVLTVRATEDDAAAEPFSDVLIPTDGGDRAAVAAEVGVDVAATYDASVHALSVVDTMTLGVDVRSGGMVDALEDAARAAVERVAERASAAGVGPVETALEYGDPYREIRDYVEDSGVDLVVMGTHGRSGVERYLLGSVTEKLVRTAPVPVLTVRPPEDGD